MTYNKLIAMKKSRKIPHEGDVFCIQPLEGIFYFGKVIKTDLENYCVRGHTLVFIYDRCFDNKNVKLNFENMGLLISPIIVNKQPWLNGYFETLYNTGVLEREKKFDYGFLNVLKNLVRGDKEYLDIDGNVLNHVPQYYDLYALGSYGIVGKNVQRSIISKIVKKMRQNPNFYVKEATGELNISTTHIPCEVKTFYELCGGAKCYIKGKDMVITILASKDIIQTEQSKLIEMEEHLSGSWYVVAQINNGDQVFIDFSKEGDGRCCIKVQGGTNKKIMLTRNFTEFLNNCIVS